MRPDTAVGLSIPMMLFGFLWLAMGAHALGGAWGRNKDLGRAPFSGTTFDWFLICLGLVCSNVGVNLFLYGIRLV